MVGSRREPLAKERKRRGEPETNENSKEEKRGETQMRLLLLLGASVVENEKQQVEMGTG